jgi:dTMP kinase
MIREILLHKKEISLAASAELLLFEADRAQHVSEVVLPALCAGKTVICDRFSAATMAYQGYGRGMDREFIKRVDAFATGGLEPDLTIILDVDVKTGLSRVKKVRATDKMERLGLQFHKKVREGFLEVAKKCGDSFKVVDSSGTLEAAYSGTREQVYGLIKRYKRAK